MTKPADSDQAELQLRQELLLEYKTSYNYPNEYWKKALELMERLLRAESKRQAVKEKCCRAVCDFCRETDVYGPATFGDEWLHEVLCDPEDYRVCLAGPIRSMGEREKIK